MTYENATEHLLDELERIETLLQRYAAATDGQTLRHEMDEDSAGNTTSVDEPTELEFALPSRDRDDLREAQSLLAEKRAHARQHGVELRLETLVEAFDLADMHRDVVLLALLPDVDPDGAQLYREVHDDSTRSRLTVGLLADLFAKTPAEFVTALELVGPDSPLVSHDLLVLDQPADDASSSWLEHSIRPDPRIRSYLLGHDGVDPVLQAHLEAQSSGDAGVSIGTVAAGTTLGDLLIGDALQEELAALPDGDEGGRRVYFHGPDGSGTHRAVEALRDSDRYLQVDLRTVLAADALDALVREATLLDRPVHLSNADAATFDDRETDHSLEAVLARFADFDGDVYVTGRREWTPSNVRDSPVDAIVEFDRPSIAQRRQYWHDALDRLDLDADAEALASTFDLTQGQLEAALATARALAGADDLTVEHLRAGCRAQSSDALDDLAQHIEPRHTWDDIELDEDTERQLRRLQSHITNRGTIYDDWGFREREGTAGVVALFKGLPGTGKTMAAEVLASAVGMDIYKIDLSSVVSKYIGETEENLEQIFEAAEQSNTILLFDEADSIFGDRAEVSDATDRYANVEVNYLLQRIETYDGIVVLTTNYATNMDTAFARRITHSIRFDRPDQDARAEIWANAFPEDTPIEDLDTEWLAGFEYSGGEISKLAKHIAVRATEQNAETITQPLVVRALERYKRDRDQSIREADFEPYLDHLAGETERERKEAIHARRRRSK
ncbi:ATP-binding protein [Halovivax limisalsi]|uniref:ATP-binding protein n=1 Tax=Halovivax limisalsi TaxID=1453760 RepID=UPI001FFD8988|nr:AAA family ATPase [Halovivax limisalsi]